jgi:hypothetical protein
MEQTPAWQGLPPDSADRSALLIFFASLVCGCIALFGERVPLLYLGVPAGCTLILYIFLRLQRTGSGFSLDDTARELRLHDGRALPFNTITFFRLILFRDCAGLQVMTGALRRRRLIAWVARPGPVQDILHALAERGFTVRVSKNPFKKRTAELLPLIVMPLLAAALVYVSIDMLKRFPGLAVPSRQLTVEPATEHPPGQLHQLGTTSFFLPQNFVLIQKQPDSAMFLHPAAGTRIAIGTAPARQTIPHKPAVQAVARILGFGNTHAAAELAVRSRFGLMPVLIKSALLKNYDTTTVHIYRVRAGRYSGVMLLGEQPRPVEDDIEHIPEQVAEITLRCADTTQIIRVLIVSRLHLSTERISDLIAGIH